MENLKLFEAEYRFMSIIWDNEPINSTELSKLALTQMNWKKPTTYNMIRKLCERGILVNENAVVTSLVKREQVQKYESESVVEKNFDGSLPAFLAAFLSGKKLTSKEAEEIKKMIEEVSE